ncbi:MAG: hypothetical protein GX897_03390 [Clostridiales bacterium]|nr:hypothetical protein [Clostridiales bacterium]
MNILNKETKTAIHTTITIPFMTEKNKAIRVFVALLIVFCLLLPSCSRSIDITPSVADIRERSAAAAFLAQKAEEGGGFIAADDQRDKASDNNAYLYDNALAVVVLVSAGAQGYAEMIADAIVFAQEHDRTFSDGRLRNVYIAGDPKSDSGRSIAAGKVTVRLPGFWQDGKWQEDSYTVSTSAGNMAWTVLALCAVAKNTSAEKQAGYLTAAMNAADFVLALESEHGGFTAGYEGWDDAQIKVTYISTEHNIDLYVAFTALYETISGVDESKAIIYKAAADTAKNFIFTMYDNELGCFYTGTLDDGKTTSDGVIPLDTNSLAVLALGDELDDPYKTLAFVEGCMAVGAGFDFSAGDLDGIWNEGTAQIAVCYHMLKSAEKYDAVMDYLKTQTAKDGSVPAADRDGVSTGFVIAGSDILWEYNNVQSISATGWLALAQLGRNPFRLDFE